MKNNKQKYLPLYKKWVKKNGFSQIGSLCMVFDYEEYEHEYLLIAPSQDDILRISKEGKDSCYWGSDSYLIEWGVFTPLRQNLVLLMAALNNEL